MNRAELAREVVENANRMEDMTMKIQEVRRYFFETNNDAEALQLSLQAMAAGYTYPLFPYVAGYCYNNGVSVAMDKAKAAHYFTLGAEYRDANGSCISNQYSDECRVILAQDFCRSQREFGEQDCSRVIRYCETLINCEKHRDDALLYLCLIYGDAKFGRTDSDQVLKYAELLAKSSDPEKRRLAADVKRQFSGSGNASSGNSGKTGGCYIATAVYGSYDCPQVWTLRRFRDEVLAKSAAGRLFVRIYYAVSPHLVRIFGGSRVFNALNRPWLDAMVKKLNGAGFADTPYRD